MRTFHCGDIFSGENYPDLINNTLGTKFDSYIKASVPLDNFELPGVIAWFVFMDGSEHGYPDRYTWKNFLGGDTIVEEASSNDRSEVIAMQDKNGHHPFRLAFQIYPPKSGEWRCRFVGAFSLSAFLREDLTIRKYIKISDDFKLREPGDIGGILNKKEDFYENMPKYFTPVERMGFSHAILQILRNNKISTAGELLELGLGASGQIADEVRQKNYELFKEPGKKLKSPPPTKESPPKPIPPIEPPVLPVLPPPIGTTVTHRTYGEGTIVKIDETNRHITVSFSYGEKLFVYPNCFDGNFLEIKEDIIMNNELYHKIQAIIFGHAVGDAVGGPVQFEERRMRDQHPVTDMVPFYDAKFPKGAWSDDTSMSLCAMDALINHGLDFESVMENFRRWLFHNEFTPTGRTFDVGRACFKAIDRSRRGIEAEACGCSGEYENGNGSLMRIYPFSLYLYGSDFPLEGKLDLIHRASALTHAHLRSCIGCGIYTFILWELLENPTKQGIKDGLKKAEAFYQGQHELCHYHRLFEKGFESLPREEIRSSGYVVDTLEAAVWCVLTTNSYRDCVLKAVNLGLDTDSVGAVAGSLAGLLYGYDGIPKDWRDSLCKKEYLTEIGKEFYERLISL